MKEPIPFKKVTVKFSGGIDIKFDNPDEVYTIETDESMSLVSLAVFITRKGEEKPKEIFLWHEDRIVEIHAENPVW